MMRCPHSQLPGGNVPREWGAKEDDELGCGGTPVSVRPSTARHWTTPNPVMVTFETEQELELTKPPVADTPPQPRITFRNRKASQLRGKASICISVT